MKRLQGLHKGLCIGMVGLAMASSLQAQDQSAAPLPETIPLSLLERLEATEKRLHELEQQYQLTLPSQARNINETAPSDNPTSNTVKPSWEAGYKNGFFLHANDPIGQDYELRINGRMQFRYTGFFRDIDEWVDQSGNVRRVTNRNDFEIERGRLEFRGHLFDPRMQYFLNLDFDTDDGQTVEALDYWFNYVFSESFNLHVGKAFIPGCRDWLNGTLRTRLADRSMATTFFRPDRTIGIWAQGEPSKNLFYRAMIGNGLNTNALSPADIDTHFVYAGSMWANWGDYGQGYSDLEWHEDWVSQFGHSYANATSDGRDAVGIPLIESNYVRLSDGTRLNQRGAITPLVTIDHFNVQLYTVDVALKYRGFSCNGEYFFRWIQALRGNGPVNVSQIFDHGFYFEMGYFVIPHRLELNGRVSLIFGAYGDAQEYAGGINWFFDGTHNWKFTVDLTRLNQNPATNTGVNIRAGDDGLLLRAQLQAAF